MSCWSWLPPGSSVPGPAPPRDDAGQRWHRNDCSPLLMGPVLERATARDASGGPAARRQYWWWVDTARAGRFYARGSIGQFVHVDPAGVVVRLGPESGRGDWPEILRDVAVQVERLPAGG
ncbi:hypothetical protein [Kocuria rosea]|uniref:hypothetical protein n=1 Tax=Kocuria rosea TaxID=1275 RepID=UPI00203C87A2|nr:hypothetical protein [Kocuria rosea]